MRPEQGKLALGMGVCGSSQCPHCPHSASSPHEDFFVVEQIQSLFSTWQPGSMGALTQL